MSPDPSPPPRAALRLIGPGIVLAATGVGAGDLVAASVAGARFGFTLVWAALVGAACRNGSMASIALLVCLALFGLLGGIELLAAFGGGR